MLWKNRIFGIIVLLLALLGCYIDLTITIVGILIAIALFMANENVID